QFYYLNREINYKRVLPPPKEIQVDDKGRLFLKSFYGWNESIRVSVPQSEFAHVIPIFQNTTASMELMPDKWTFNSVSGYEVYAFQKPGSHIIWEGTLHLEGMGKSGFVLNVDGEGNGYFISMDFVNGYVQIRRWGFNPDDYLNNFKFENLQTGLFKPPEDRKVDFRLISYGYYIELSIADRVVLTLVDYQFEGDLIGLYSASSVVSLTDSEIHILEKPETEYAVKDSDQ